MKDFLDNLEEKIEKDNDYIVCSIVGNVDNGKTFLLNKLTKEITKETRNITQKINYFVLNLENKKHIVLLDTPGHETFSFTKEVCMDICDIVFFVVSIKDIEKSSFDQWINYFSEKNLEYIVLLSKLDNFKSISEYRKKYFQLGLNKLSEDKIFGIQYPEFKYEEEIKNDLLNYQDLIPFLEESISNKKKIISPNLIYVLNKEKNEGKPVEYLVLDLSNEKKEKTFISEKKVLIYKENKNLLLIRTKFDMFPGDVVILNDKSKTKIREKKVVSSNISPIVEQEEKFFVFSSNENKILALCEIFNKLNLKVSKTFLGKPDTILEKMIQNGSINAIFYDVKSKLNFPNIYSSNNIYDIEDYLKENFIVKIEQRKLLSKILETTIGKAKVKAIFNIGKNVIAGCDVFDEIKKDSYVSIIRKDKIIGKNLVISSMKTKLISIEKTIPKTEVGFLLKDFVDFKPEDILHFHNNLI